ncbi:PREDICTED: TOM1-like protein 1 isoform X1 [Lupinus angustifolius]|uniref:TOM1-like protein 1 isoform X1 n=2 Tax=Lupinus angustifolius TaxID=3871 RepID=UPI00092FADB3|nr:PREDICTED: TOM1-like protein 1 isoform X1 [Lupinus angustifolius]XP_019450379.1 PREDICTED: TOM1-like protein 1 isoform X1 [Lupinus angustifolius]XP_019450380.1 PREDICTED: TOM1-like protein 1 isoform X1 [Lupinus angustifolius]
MAGSSSSATVAVEKATSDLLMGPDWTMNIEICDSINSNHWQPKDVVKAVKKRLQHRSSKVQLLALTLLETMVKNCGDFVHYQIAERNILDEMIKIVRKKTDMQVRDKILVLLDSWQEAFGGPGGKHPQYYWAYDELRRSGVGFPKRSSYAAPIFTPPPTHPTSRNMQPGYGMPGNSSKTLDETMATEIESLSLSSLDSMRDVMDLLTDMLQAVNPSDRAAVKDEVITDLVDRCRTNQKKLMQMLTTTGDEELLGRGLELNDSIQSLLARHDAIATGAPLPIQGTSSSTVSTEVHSSVNQTEEVKISSPGVESVSTPKASPSALVLSETRDENDEEEEDEFAQLARRHSKTKSMTSSDAATSSTTPHIPEPSISVPSNALAVTDLPAPVRTSKDQNIIDLLSITLSLTPSSPQTTTYAPPVSTEGYSYAPSQTSSYPGNLSHINSYVAPWAQPQSMSESQPPTAPSPQQQLHTHYESEQFLHHQHSQPQQQQSQHVWQQQPQSQFQSQNPHYSPPQQHLQPLPEPQQLHSQPQSNHYSQLQPQPQQQLQSQTTQQPQPQPKFQNQDVQYSARYPPPPWGTMPGYGNYQNHLSATNMSSNPQSSTTASSYTPAQGVRPLQHNNSFPSRPISDTMGNSGPHSNPATGQQNQKPFVPSYQLFEDLNVFGKNTDGRSSKSSAMGPGMVGGRK